MIFWAITFKNQQKVIRTICLWNISEDGTTSEIGFELLPEYQGKGIMQEVIPIIIKYSFQNTKLQSIEGEVDLNNLKSIKLMKKNGFIYHKRLDDTDIYALQNPSNKNY